MILILNPSYQVHVSAVSVSSYWLLWALLVGLKDEDMGIDTMITTYSIAILMQPVRYLGKNVEGKSPDHLRYSQLLWSEKRSEKFTFCGVRSSPFFKLLAPSDIKEEAV